ncbi:MAG: RluA family pseudouridine synthase [bacterium]
MPEIEIIFQNAELIAVNKPAGLLTVPGRGGAVSEPCLTRILREKTGENLLPVHRLDREVSGVVIFARNQASHRRLNALFEGRDIFKTYLALVCGRIEKDSGEIDKPVREYGSGRMGISAAGKSSLTRFKVLERLKNHTLLQVNPVTGRRHQIRVHLYSIGHPVAGDPLYGDRKLQNKYPRLMLHSAGLELPVSGKKKIAIKAEPPEEFQALLKSLC